MNGWKKFGKRRDIFPTSVLWWAFIVCFHEGEQLTLWVNIGRKSGSCIMCMFKKQNIKYCKLSGSFINYCQLHHQLAFYVLVLVVVSRCFDTATFSDDSSAVLNVCVAYDVNLQWDNWHCFFVPYRKHWRKCGACHNTGHWPNRDAAMGNASVNRIRKPDDFGGEGFRVHKCWTGTSIDLPSR